MTETRFALVVATITIAFAVVVARWLPDEYRVFVALTFAAVGTIFGDRLWKRRRILKSAPQDLLDRD